MRAAWRLGISSLSGRKGRTALLVGAVALSSALIAAVSCALASVQEGMKQRVEATVGSADIQIARTGKAALDDQTVAAVMGWSEAKAVAGRAKGPIALKNARTGATAATIGNGINPEQEERVRAVRFLEGRGSKDLGEIAVDRLAAEALGAKIGDKLQVERWGEPIELTLVGIVQPAELGMGIVTRWESRVTLAQLGKITGEPGKVEELAVILKDSTEAESVAKKYQAALGSGVLVKTSAKITSGLDQSQRSGQVGMTVASMLATLAASFIIMTGLTTSVTERLREMAMIRCIGATKGQMAASQLVVGATVGLLGAVVGVPLGVLGALVLVRSLPEQFPGGFTINWLGMGLGVAGSLCAGLLGGVYPAIQAARTSPIEAMTVRSRPVRGVMLVVCGILGALFALAHIGVMTSSKVADIVFWLDMTIGIPSVFIGYFLLAVPGLWVVTALAGGAVERVLAVPRGLLVRTVRQAPYRFGFTAGAMMLGLALLVAIWTNGKSMKNDWLNSFEFPDAFAVGLSISEKTQEKVKSLPFVTGTVALTTQNFKTDAFGLKAFDNTQTTFIAFEPEPFFKMTTLKWDEGDPKTALARLQAGGAVLVAKPFKVTRGLGVGQKIRLLHEGKPHEFDIVGVVESPVLDIVSKFYEVGDNYADMSVNAVFGNREDLKRLFGNTSVRLMQIGLTKDIADDEAIKQIRKVGGFEILEAGSGRSIRAEIEKYLDASLYIFSLVALGAMLVSCFGVANLIVAGIQARQYEFGVLRAVGAQRGLLARMVLGEAVLIALTACVLGTVMGAQAAWAGRKMQTLIIGIELPGGLVSWGPTAIGWGILTAITLGAALPAVLALNRKLPRELLGAVRG